MFRIWYKENKYSNWKPSSLEMINEIAITNMAKKLQKQEGWYDVKIERSDKPLKNRPIFVDETPNEWRIRIKNPDLFYKDSFRVKEIGRGIKLVMGKLIGGTGAMTTQSYHFNKSAWSRTRAYDYVENLMKQGKIRFINPVVSSEKELLEKSKIKFVVNAIKWFDKVNGNTYHSVKVVRVSDGKSISSGFTYGYGNQYESTALSLMLKNGWLPSKYNEKNIYSYERENNYPILWQVHDGLKRDVVHNNPARSRGAEVIYSNVQAIFAKKGAEDIFKGEEFVHEFKAGAVAYGLPDGSILIKSKSGKRLWAKFDYPAGTI